MLHAHLEFDLTLMVHSLNLDTLCICACANYIGLCGHVQDGPAHRSYPIRLCKVAAYSSRAIMSLRVTVDLRPSSPASSVRSNRSCSSTSTLDSVSVAYESAPPLCPLLSVREHSLSKRPQTHSLPGWGLVLRGTTSELSEGSKIYSCQIESIHHDGAAKV